MKSIIGMMCFSLLLLSCHKDKPIEKINNGHLFNAKVNGDAFLANDLLSLGADSGASNYYSIQVTGSKITASDTSHMV